MYLDHCTFKTTSVSGDGRVVSVFSNYAQSAEGGALVDHTGNKFCNLHDNQQPSLSSSPAETRAPMFTFGVRILRRKRWGSYTRASRGPPPFLTILVRQVSECMRAQVFVRMCSSESSLSRSFLSSLHKGVVS